MEFMYTNKIFVDNLPYKCLQSKIVDIFSKFGQITDIEIINKKTRRKSKTQAFITYADSFCAFECYWNNWPATVFKNNLSIIPVKSKMTPTAKPILLTMLDDDCILLIFSYMSVMELFRIETVSSRFGRLVRYQLNRTTEFSMLDWDNGVIPMKNYTFQKLMKRIGTNVRNLTIHRNAHNDNNMLNFINCPKLENIVLIGFQLHKELGLHYEWFKQLRSVTFDRCVVSDKSLTYLNNNIEEIILVMCEHITGIFLKEIVPLQRLTVMKCRHFKSAYILEAFSKPRFAFKHLEFDLETYFFYMDILPNTPNLEHLTCVITPNDVQQLRMHTNGDHIYNMRKLRKVVIYSQIRPLPNDIKQLIANHLQATNVDFETNFTIFHFTN